MKLLGSFRKPSPVRLGSLLILYGLIAVVLVAIAFAAQERHPPKGPTRVQEIVMRPIFAQNGVLLAHHVKATLQRVVYHPSGQIDAETIGSVEFDLVKGEHQSVTLGGETYDYREYGDLAIVIAEQEWKKTMPDALPQRRRALRQP